MCSGMQSVFSAVSFRIETVFIGQYSVRPSLNHRQLLPKSPCSYVHTYIMHDRVQRHVHLTGVEAHIINYA